MLKKLTALINVKSIVTITLTYVFSILALREDITADQFLTVFTSVIAFYFGIQYEKKNE